MQVSGTLLIACLLLSAVATGCRSDSPLTNTSNMFSAPSFSGIPPQSEPELDEAQTADAK